MRIRIRRAANERRSRSCGLPRPAATGAGLLPAIGHPLDRLPNHASFAFKDMDGNLLLTMLDAAGFACSSGSACKTGNPEPSEVMAAIGLEREWGLGSLRITLGAASTPAQVEAFLKVLPGLVQKARVLKAINA